MKKLLLVITALAAQAAIAQTSCGTAFPSWMLCNNSTQTLYVPNLALTGGVTYPAGQYIVNINSSGALSYAAYTAPPMGPQGPPGIGIQGPAGPRGEPGTPATLPTAYPGHISFPPQTIPNFGYSCQGFGIPPTVTDGIYAINPTGRPFSKALIPSGFMYNLGTISYCLYNASPDPITFTTSQLYTVMVTPVQ
jgi:hypothetical protein